MTDFDTLLREVLADGAEGAPAGDGLARGARDRARSRRNRRASLGASAAVLAVVLPVGVAVVGGGATDRPVDSPTGTPTTTSGVDEALRAVTYDGVTFEVPSDWQWATRGPYLTYRPDSFSRPLTTGLSFVDTRTEGALRIPGVITRTYGRGEPLWFGHVQARDWAVLVYAPDLDLARQILASVHEAGQPQVDGSTWEESSRDGISWEFPSAWGLGEGADLTGYGVCATDVPGNGPLASPVESQVDAAHYRVERQVDDHLVTVVAPTRAVADLVLATVDDAPDAPYGECALAGDGALEPGSSGDERPSGTGDSAPCDPGEGFPRPRADCPDPEPETGWLTIDDGGRLWFEPFRTLGNDREGREYAAQHGLEYPFPNDYYDASTGDRRPFDLESVSVCTGSIMVASTVDQHWDSLVDCDAFRNVFAAHAEQARIPVAVWSGSGKPVLQLSELYRP